MFKEPVRSNKLVGKHVSCWERDRIFVRKDLGSYPFRLMGIRIQICHCEHTKFTGDDNEEVIPFGLYYVMKRVRVYEQE